MRTLILKLLVLLGLCAAMVLWFNCVTPTPPAPLLYSFSPNPLHLDTAFVGGRAATGVVVLTNLSERKILTLETLSGDCPSEITWTPQKDTLFAGESGSFAFHFDPQQAYPNTDCSLKASVERGSSSENPDLAITFAAGEAACALSPSEEFDFGDVPPGTYDDLTLTLRNTTPDLLSANQFAYEFRNPSSDCRAFSMNVADSAGVLGQGAAKHITVRFQPDVQGPFECRRELVSLRVPPDAEHPHITNPCPTAVTWRGTGVIGPPVWSTCVAGGNKDLHSVFGLSGSEIYAAGDGGRVLASGGNCQWLATGTGFADVDLRDIWAYSTGGNPAIWAVGNIPPPPGTYRETGAILKSDGGLWRMVDEDGFLTYAAVWGSGVDDVYFAGLGIATDFPNAKRWNGSTLGTLRMSEWGISTVTGVSGTAANDVWAVLGQAFNSVFHFQGDEWQGHTQGFMTKPLHDVWAVQGTGFYGVYAVGEDGAIYHYDGTTWTDESIEGEARDFYGVWVSPTGQVFVVGEGHAIYRGQVNDPTGWTAQSPPPGLAAGDLLDVWGSADDSVFAVGTNGVILRYAPGG